MTESHIEIFPETAELLTATSHGQEDAFTLLFDKYKHRVFSIALAYTENKADAEEIVQEVFLRIWKIRERLPEIDQFAAWLQTVTRNRCLTALKKKALEEQRRSSVTAQQPTSAEEAETVVQEKEMQLALHTALTRLSPQQRKVFIMSRLQGLDRSTIALQLELAPATVSVHLTIALRSIRNYLASHMQGATGLLILSLLVELPR